MRFSCKLTIAALAALGFGVTGSNAAPITNLFNTGTTATNTAVPLTTTYPTDLHYTVVASPVGTGTPIVVNTPAGSFPTPPWVANSATSDWISGPQAAGTPPRDPSPNGNYDYRTTFTTSDLGVVSISGTLTADDQVLQILINGVAAITTGLPTTNQGYSSLFPFTATATGPAVLGTNTIDFIVANNFGVVQGLRVDALVGTTGPGTVPEPASLVMLGSGLVGILGLAGVRRMKKVA